MIKLFIKIIFLPYTVLWHLGIWTIKMLGRFLAFMLGLFLVIFGIAISVTIVGAIIGIPLIMAGLSMALRSLF